MKEIGLSNWPFVSFLWIIIINQLSLFLYKWSLKYAFCVPSCNEGIKSVCKHRLTSCVYGTLVDMIELVYPPIHLSCKCPSKLSGFYWFGLKVFLVPPNLDGEMIEDRSLTLSLKIFPCPFGWVVMCFPPQLIML